MSTPDLINHYYAAFNRQDWEGMLALLTDDIAHDVNQASAKPARTTSAPSSPVWIAATASR